jgi:hypothetical protein
MQIFAVFLPSGLPPARAAEKAELVRQGFGWDAFLLTPLWALRHGLWLALSLWAAWLFLVALVASLGHLAPASSFVVYALGALAFGLEADRFRQTSLSRSGFLLQGLALGESTNEAESLYFRRRGAITPTPAAVFAASPVVSADEGARPDSMNGETDLLGLFPPQETKR